MPSVNEGYYRFPTLRGETIVFTAEGDLWKVSVAGGTAQRLTTHHGVESHAAIAPDGSQVAFSAEYEGAAEVYLMPMSGGVPIRLTYDGEPSHVVGWSPDGRIIYATRSRSGLPNTQLIMINPQTLSSEIIPLSQASDGVFDPTGNTLFFTRLPFQGSHTKRYRGGTVQNIWRFTRGADEAEPLTTDYPGTSKNPMWWDGRIYFLSDRDGTMNIWSMAEDGSDVKQHTYHKGSDIGKASLDGGRIVYQLLADIRLYDIDSGEDRRIEISLASDFDQMREKWIKKPMDYLTSFHLSPKGDRVVLTARGQVFVAPVHHGRFVRATHADGVRYRNARFMPDGESVIALSDETGELEFYKIPANGLGKPEALTNDGTVFRFEGIPSPDGKLIAYADKDNKLWLLDTESRQQKCIAESDTGGYRHLSWSPDSKWLAYVNDADNTYSRINIYGVESGETTQLTSDRVDSYNPVWSPDGKWIYFLSDRVFKSLVPSPWGPRQPEPFFDKTTKIYMIGLRADERSPFLPDDELNPKPEAQEEKKKEDQNKDNTPDEQEKGTKKDEKKVEVVIDFEGITQRVFEVPLPEGKYSNLSVTEKYLYWVERESGLNGKSKIQLLEIKNRNISANTFINDVGNYEMSLDRKKIMFRKGDAIYVVDVGNKAPDKLEEFRVNLNGWSFNIDPKQEWRQMLIEAWRLERDYFYDPGMHGVDYKGLLEKHLALIDRVTDRDELSDLMAHLVGELSALHTFVRGGDLRRGNNNIGIGKLGARLSRDEANGGYRVDHIYRTDPDYPDKLSPLLKPGVDVVEGDIITEINGVSVLAVPDISVLLRNQVGKQTLLTIKSERDRKSDKAIVVPISVGAESDLRYSEWEYTRRLIVEEKGNGEIGYVHLRAMGGNNYSEWVRDYYPVFNRKGLIIDVRHNRGGNIDSWILEKLLRKAWFYWKSRNGKPTWNMQYAFRGHKVALCNEFTASDGEAFTEGFRRLGLGKVIGTRTWGGEIWLSFSNWLVDKGIASAAETGVFGPEGEWLIEGHGVDPDIVVDNLPHATFTGKDAQLDAAIDYLLRKIEEEPVEEPVAPPFPVKAWEY